MSSPKDGAVRRGGPPWPPPAVSKTLADYVDGLVEGRRGDLFQTKRGRQVWRVRDGERTWFAKRGVGTKRREIRREAQNARALSAERLGPAVLASGLHGGAEWLVTESAGLWPLAGSLSNLPGGEGERALLERVAHAIRRLHEHGISLPDMQQQHIYVEEGPTLFIDPARMTRRGGSASVRERARGLAALLFSLCDLHADRRIRDVRIVRRASGWRGDRLHGLLEAIEQETAKLRARTRWRHHFVHSSGEYHDVLLDVVFGGGGEKKTPRDVHDRKWMTLVRRLPDRENWRFGTDEHGKPRFFVKFFPPCGSRESPATRELVTIERFRRSGIPVNIPAAHWDDLDEGSMIAVKACAGEPLDDLLRRGVTPHERRALAAQTAAIWRRMRDAGLRHRDAYPCHVFAARSAARFELRLIDLTRAGPAPFPRERWFVKDAAQLWHGLPKPPVTRTDAVRWLRAYFRIAKLTPAAKRFARKVAAKERSISARQVRRAKRKAPA